MKAEDLADEAWSSMDEGQRDKESSTFGSDVNPELKAYMAKFLRPRA
jgi:hypothetical protein